MAFVTSATYGSDLDGLTGADLRCQLLAVAARLPGNYRAWISDSSGSPATRFRRSGQEYLLITGNPIAANWTDLTTLKPNGNYLVRPLNRTEEGVEITDQSPVPRAWTATDTNGALDPAASTCAGWESTSSEVSGDIGLPTGEDASWTDAGFATCGVDQARLYCFQQD